MIVSIPIPTNSHTCSESSGVRTLDDMITEYGDDHYLRKDLDLKNTGEGKVYRQSLTKDIHVVPYKSRTHKVDDVVVVNGHHHIITKVITTAGKKWAYQPEEYTDNEKDFSKWRTWTGRYFRVKKRDRIAWSLGDRGYFFFHHERPSVWAWKAWDKTTNGCYNSMTIGMKVGYSYSSAKDIIGFYKYWGGGGSPREDTFVFKSAVGRGDYWYFRTHIKYKVKYHTSASSTKYSTKRIYSPKEINGFRYNRMTACFSAFDDKNYTKGEFTPDRGYIDFSFVTTAESDTIALGRVYAETASVTVRDEGGKVIFSVTDYPIQNEIASTSIGQDANVILYSDKVLPPASTVTVRLKAAWISIGRILSGSMVRLGFTNTIFENGFKDFSPKEQDQWGNVVYKNGVRVFIHNGTVDLPLSQYDSLNRAFMYIGGQELIINSSDSVNNTPPNSLTIFQSTMFIGRFTAFKQKTKNVGDLMDSVATWVFAAEESV